MANDKGKTISLLDITSLFLVLMLCAFQLPEFANNTHERTIDGGGKAANYKPYLLRLKLPAKSAAASLTIVQYQRRRRAIVISLVVVVLSCRVQVRDASFKQHSNKR